MLKNYEGQPPIVHEVSEEETLEAKKLVEEVFELLKSKGLTIGSMRAILSDCFSVLYTWNFKVTLDDVEKIVNK